MINHWLCFYIKSFFILVPIIKIFNFNCWISKIYALPTGQKKIIYNKIWSYCFPPALTFGHAFKFVYYCRRMKHSIIYLYAMHGEL